MSLVPNHCSDLQNDRSLGQFWEERFCSLAASYGKMFTAHQINRGKSAAALIKANGKYHRLLLPDITVWSAPGEHHEIKHKSPTKSGCFGLEDYRLVALKWFADETQQKVFYTIHDWASAGGREVRENRPNDWFACEIGTLWQATLSGVANKAKFDSWVGGKKQTKIEGWFWPSNLWSPVIETWEMP